MAAKTLFEKIWESHVVQEKVHEPSCSISILHLVHEVTSPQAFEGLRHSGRTIRAPHRTFATQESQRADHRSHQADHRPRFESCKSKRCAATAPSFNVMLLRPRLARPGNYPRDRSAARTDTAGHDDRLRRQSYRDARRVRRARVPESAPAKSSTCSRRNACGRAAEDF